MRIRHSAKLLAIGPVLFAAKLLCGEALVSDGGTSSLHAALSKAAVVSDDDLSGMRGGFFTAGGAQFDFGASVRTMVNGQVALETNLQWTPAGPVTTQVTGLGSQIQAQVNQAIANNLAKAGLTSPLPTTPASTGTAESPSAAPAASTAPTQVAAAAVPVAAAADAAVNSANAGSANPAAAASNAVASAGGSALTGVQVPGTGGSTQVFANIGGGQIQNIIMNSASGQTITQNTNVNLTIYNFQAWQADLANRVMAARLATDMLAASGVSAGH